MSTPAKLDRTAEETCDDVQTAAERNTPQPMFPPTVEYAPGQSNLLPTTVQLDPAAADSLRTTAESLRGDASWPAIPGYEIIGELGRGGMGVVYRARQQRANRLVAIKMLLAGEHAGAEHRARFQTEFQAIASLQSPHIVQMFEVGEHGGLPFFTMEFVPGGSLSHRIAGKPQPAADSARIVEAIARAMQVAHNLGIVHRDLKPANILLAFGDHASTTSLDPAKRKLLADGPLSSAIPKITDFGLAKRLELDSSNTRSGAIMGSPSYMSPEQARGDVHDVGPLADVYATGTILYELLTGRPPFLAASAIDTVQQVVNAEPVAPSRLASNVPRDLETICLKCLQKDPQKRYASAAALADDLTRFQRAEPILARPVSAAERLWRWCRRNPGLAAASAASILFLVIATAVSTWSAITLAQKNDVIQKEKDVAIEAQRTAQAEATERARQQAIAEEEARNADAARKIADSHAKTASEQSTENLVTIQLVIENINNELGELPGTQQVREGILKLAEGRIARVADAIDKSTSKEATDLASRRALGSIYSQSGKTDKAYDYFVRALELARERVVIREGADAARSNLARVLRDLGQASQEVNRDMRVSLKYYEEARQVWQDILDHPNAGGGNAASPIFVKRDLGEEHTRVAATIYRLGNPAAAVEHFRQAFELRRELVEALAADDVLKRLPPKAKIAFRQDLARSKLSMGEMSFRLSDPETATVLYSEGIAEFEQLYREWPSLRLKHELGRTHGNFGDIKLHIEGPTAALPHYDRCRSLLQELVDLDPNEAPYQRDLGLARYRLGNYALRVKDPSSAVEHFRACLKLRETLVALDKSNDRRQMELMLALAHCGEHRRAAELAQKYADSQSPDNEMLLDVARCFAQCASGEGKSDLDADYAAKAITSLTAAVTNGYRDAVYLESEPDLDPLRDRADFKHILNLARRGD